MLTTSPRLHLLPGAIADILASVAETGCLSQGDRYGLMAAILDESASEEDLRATNRLLRSVARGRVRVNGLRSRSPDRTIRQNSDARAYRPDRFVRFPGVPVESDV